MYGGAPSSGANWRMVQLAATTESFAWESTGCQRLAGLLIGNYQQHPKLGCALPHCRGWSSSAGCAAHVLVLLVGASHVGWSAGNLHCISHDGSMAVLALLTGGAVSP